MTHEALISLGGKCWVAKLVQRCAPGPEGVFDEIGVSPSIVAMAIDDNFADLLADQHFVPCGRREAHYHHSIYSPIAFGLVDAVIAEAHLPSCIRMKVKQRLQEEAFFFDTCTQNYRST